MAPELKLVSNDAQQAQRQNSRTQYSTFYVAGEAFGIDVTKVQEVVKPMTITKVPLAPSYVSGLINLRGQVVSTVGLRDMFGVDSRSPDSQMNVVCRVDGQLISLLVDEIGDVIEVTHADQDAVPRTVPESVRKYLSGVHKLKNSLMSVLDIDKIFQQINR